MRELSAKVLMTCAAIAASATIANAQGSWTKKAPMAAALNEVALAGVGTKIHVIGGGVLGVAGPYHQEYDTEKDTWRPRALLPKGLDHIGATVLNGKVYTIGGFVGSVHRDAQNAAYEYDPASDSWRILAWMKAPRASVGVAALGGKIYAVGGRNPDGQVVGTNEVYDPATNTWKVLAPLPRPRDHTATVAANGRIHVIGGRTGGPTDRVDLHDVYDPSTNTWSSATAAADPAQRACRRALQGPHPGARWRTAAQHVRRKRSLQFEDQQLANARADAARTSRHQRRGERQQRVPRGRLAAGRGPAGSPTS